MDRGTKTMSDKTKIVAVKPETWRRLNELKTDTFSKSISEAIDVLFETNEALMKELDKLGENKNE